jgi:glycosyltransferase involved in cell wall biosynthesis
LLRHQLLRLVYLRAADLVLTVSEFSKRELVQFMGIRPDKIRVIYEAADEVFGERVHFGKIDEVRTDIGIPGRFILNVGGFEKRKNVLTLVEAFAALKRSEADIALVLVGIGGDLHAVRNRSSALGLVEGRDIFLLTKISDRTLAALYTAATLFATLSWHEGFCLPVVEAMTCGAPVLGSRFGAIPEVLGGAGCLVDPRSLEQVIEVMGNILRNPSVQDDMRSRSTARAKEFSWRRAAEETFKAYEQCVNT